MRDLYDIFEDLGKDNRSYRYNDSEDTGLPFDKVLEIVEFEEVDSMFGDE